LDSIVIDGTLASVGDLAVSLSWVSLKLAASGTSSGLELIVVLSLRHESTQLPRTRGTGFQTSSEIEGPTDGPTYAALAGLEAYTGWKERDRSADERPEVCHNLDEWPLTSSLGQVALPWMSGLGQLATDKHPPRLGRLALTCH
jgi:hypothetical protein